MITTIDETYGIFSSNKNTRKSQVSHFRKYCTWLHGIYGFDMQMDSAFVYIADHAAVQNYIDAHEGVKKPSTLQQELLTLTRLVNRLTSISDTEAPPHDPAQSWTPESYGLGQLPQALPYARHELISIIDWVNSRPTDESRRRAAAIVSLAYGAGITTGEMVGITYADVAVHGSAVLVHSHGGRGTNPRYVPVTAPWDRVLVDTVRCRPPTHTVTSPIVAPVSGMITLKKPTTAVSNFIDQNRSSGTGTAPVVGRLRHTLVAHHACHRVPFALLDHAAGITRGLDLAYRKTIMAVCDFTEAEYVAWRDGSELRQSADYPPLTSL